MRQSTVSIGLVAEKAGVSKMTVSRVIRGEGSVKEDTRKKVVAVMEKLGYVPSLAAQSLRSKDRLRSTGSRLFAAIFGSGTETAIDFFHDVLGGIEQSAADFGLCPVQVHWQENIENSWPRLQNLFSIENLCGVLLVGQFEQKDIRMIQQRTSHIVTVDGPAPAMDGIGSVESDYLEGSLLGLSHLIDAGAKKTVILTVQEEHYFAKAMEMAARIKRGESADIRIVHNCLNSRNAYDMVRKMREEGMEFDSLFTTDEFAIGAVKALYEMKISIPEQVKIIGFDDTHYASFLTPTLSSIRLDKYRLGVEAVKTLVSLIRTKTGTNEMKKVIRPSLIVRESTGGARPSPRP